MSRSDGKELYDYWRSLHKRSTGTELVANRFREVSMLQQLVDDYGRMEIESLITYYFDYKSNHKIDWFLFNYQHLMVERDRRLQDQERRRRLAEKTAERMGFKD